MSYSVALPDGLRIADTLRKNLEDIQHIIWTDGETGYNPKRLKIRRFGLNPSFIKRYKLTWIDNLITARGGFLAEMKHGKIIQGKTPPPRRKPHPNFNLPYMQKYLKKWGVRKVEATALVVYPDEGEALCRQAIEKFLGEDAEDRFSEKRSEIVKTLTEFRDRTGLDESIQAAIDLIEDEEEGLE